MMGYLSSGCYNLRSKSMARAKAGASAPLTWFLVVASGSQAEQRVVLPKAVLTRLSCHFRIEFLKLIRGHVITMTMNADSVIESLDVFEDKPVGMLVVFNPEPVKPLSLDQRMEGFDTGIVIRITFMAVAKLKLLCSFTVSL